jgi:hypothetical protein
MADARHDPSALLQEAASLFHLIGGLAPKHLVIVGGLVPPLLVPDAKDAHLGSADIDFCLSVAITQGETRQYYKSLEELIEPYFELAGHSGFRWRKKAGVAGLPILIDFLAPAGEEWTAVADGARELGDETAAANAGLHLRPFPIRSGELIDGDAVTNTIADVDLIYRPGARADVEVRHAGPVGFLAAKADAFAGRNDTKDGYDVSWWFLNANGSAKEVAQLVIERLAFKDELFQESVAELQSAYKGPEHVGPDGYAREKFPDLASGDETFEQARNTAYLRGSQVITILRENLW